MSHLLKETVRQSQLKKPQDVRFPSKYLNAKCYRTVLLHGVVDIYVGLYSN